MDLTRLTRTGTGEKLPPPAKSGDIRQRQPVGPPRPPSTRPPQHLLDQASQYRQDEPRDELDPVRPGYYATPTCTTAQSRAGILDNQVYVSRTQPGPRSGYPDNDDVNHWQLPPWFHEPDPMPPIASPELILSGPAYKDLPLIVPGQIVQGKHFKPADRPWSSIVVPDVSEQAVNEGRICRFVFLDWTEVAFSSQVHYAVHGRGPGIITQLDMHGTVDDNTHAGNIPPENVEALREALPYITPYINSTVGRGGRNSDPIRQLVRDNVEWLAQELGLDPEQPERPTPGTLNLVISNRRKYEEQFHHECEFNGKESACLMWNCFVAIDDRRDVALALEDSGVLCYYIHRDEVWKGGRKQKQIPYHPRVIAAEDHPAFPDLPAALAAFVSDIRSGNIVSKHNRIQKAAKFLSPQQECYWEVLNEAGITEEPIPPFA